MSEKEKFYDDHIAPALMDLAKQCEDRGLSLLAVVEWAPGDGGRTCTMHEAGFGFRMTELAARARGNVDSLILALMRYAAQHGHSSVCLSRLGVPHAPHDAKESNGVMDGSAPPQQGGGGGEEHTNTNTNTNAPQAQKE